VRIPEIILHSVCFLYSRAECGEKDVLGTGFFVKVPGKTPGTIPHAYLVTAKHLLFHPHDKEQRDPRQHVWVRFRNRSSGSTPRVEVTSRWYFGEDEEDVSVDIAVAPFSPPDRSTDFGVIGIGAFVTDEVANDYRIGIGDELSLCGLFSPRPGADTVLPIVRAGTIAAMPDEPVSGSRTGRRHRVYLAELRSWGGLSGSPVFVQLGYDRGPDGAINDDGEGLLLGLVSGHFGQERESQDLPYVPDELNMGIAMVSRAQDIMAILDQEALVRERREREEKHAT